MKYALLSMIESAALSLAPLRYFTMNNSSGGIIQRCLSETMHADAIDKPDQLI